MQLCRSAGTVMHGTVRTSLALASAELCAVRDDAADRQRIHDTTQKNNFTDCRICWCLIETT